VTPAHIRGDIERLIDTLFAAQVAIDSNITLLLSASGRSIVTWSNEVALSSLFGEVTSLDEYLETLRQRWYSVLLFDGSILQFSYTFFGQHLTKHRLCFLPCPIKFKPMELMHFSIEELLEVLEGQEFKDRLRLEGALRFDYDKEAGCVEHPPSHLTISRVSCRIPVSAPLSVGHFVRFLFQHFYPQLWQDRAEIRRWACSAWDSCLPELEEDHLYVHWRRA
jgi:hypothetical protein